MEKVSRHIHQQTLEELKRKIEKSKEWKEYKKMLLFSLLGVLHVPLIEYKF